MDRNARKYYPNNWEELSRYVRFVVYDGICQCCGTKHLELNQFTGKKCILQCCHIDGKLVDHSVGNLIALCNSCHFRFDNGILLNPRKVDDNVNNSASMFFF